MKKFFLSAALCTAGFITFAGAQTPLWLDPSVVSIGKELPRGGVVSLDSRENALRRDYGKSQYFQPLTEWKREDRADAVVYKTRYKIPFAWLDREQFLYLGKVSGSFGVTVNGKPAGYSQTGSTPSEFDLTAVSEEGNNDLEIAIYKNPAAAVLENSRVPYPPAILGDAYILSQPRVRVRDVFADTRMNGTSGLLQLGVIMKSHQLNPKDYRVWYELISPKGEVVSEGYKDVEFRMRREDTVAFFANIPHIMPWSHEQPALYTLFIRTQHEGRFKEYLSFDVGFRSVDMRDGVVYLNDSPLYMNMRGFVPSAETADNRIRMEALLDEGVNALKIEGAPPGREFYELCDEMGIYVCNGADLDTHLSGDSRRVGGNPSNDPAWEGAYVDRVMSMYHTSKNSPSVIMFSLAGNSSNGYNLYESYLALKTVEKHRPVIYPEGGEWNDDRVDFEAMTEIGAMASEPVVIAATDQQAGKFTVSNNRIFTPVIGEISYVVSTGGKTVKNTSKTGEMYSGKISEKAPVGGKVVASGSKPVDIPPGRTVDISVPVDGLRAGKNYTILLEVKTDDPVTRYIPADEGPVVKTLRGTVPGKGGKVLVGRSVFSGRLTQ